ncbi:hypothetical protein [Ideonella sp.]|uniref:hypothetical protein n=1 Tax=Ideonella sp. TaxID=1929293 RepID=UPI003BB7DCA1
MNATEDQDAPESSPVQEALRWGNGVWTAHVLKNEDGDGWAVAMTLQGQQEPALVGPWTMGRDKKNPKPLDVNAFNTLVKTANEVLRRHEQQRDAELHRKVIVNEPGGRITVSLDIEPDDDHPQAWLSAHDADGEELARITVSPGFKLNAGSAAAWIANEFRKPR